MAPPCTRSWATTLTAGGGWILGQATSHITLSNVSLACSILAAVLSSILTIQTLLRNRRRK